MIQDKIKHFLRTGEFPDKKMSDEQIKEMLKGKELENIHSIRDESPTLQIIEDRDNLRHQLKESAKYITQKQQEIEKYDVEEPPSKYIQTFRWGKDRNVLDENADGSKRRYSGFKRYIKEKNEPKGQSMKKTRVFKMEYD